MKSNFYNAEQHKQEKKEKELVVVEQSKREIYLESLSKNRNFQMYVIEEILDEEIKKTSNISGQLVGFLTAEPAEVQRIMIAQKAKLDAIVDIKNKINR
jgi:hypothetical protein